MSTARHFFHLQPITMDLCELTEEAHAEAEQSWLCTGCLSPKPGYGAIDVRVQESRVVGWPLSAVASSGIPIAMRSFIHSLGDDLVRRDLWIGRIYGPDGEELKEWCTWRGRRQLIVRGSEEAGYRHCPQCGRILYFAMGKRHLYPDPGDDTELFEGNRCGLIVPEHLFKRLDLSRRKQLGIDKVPVVSQPLDGFEKLEPV